MLNEVIYHCCDGRGRGSYLGKNFKNPKRRRRFTSHIAEHATATAARASLPSSFVKYSSPRKGTQVGTLNLTMQMCNASPSKSSHTQSSSGGLQFLVCVAEEDRQGRTGAGGDTAAVAVAGWSPSGGGSNVLIG